MGKHVLLEIGRMYGNDGMHVLTRQLIGSAADAEKALTQLRKQFDRMQESWSVQVNVYHEEISGLRWLRTSYAEKPYLQEAWDSPQHDLDEVVDTVRAKLVSIGVMDAGHGGD